jgi:hypothetical protein
VVAAVLVRLVLELAVQLMAVLVVLVQHLALLVHL